MDVERNVLGREACQALGTDTSERHTLHSPFAVVVPQPGGEVVGDEYGVVQINPFLC